MHIELKTDDLSDGAVARLLHEHRLQMHKYSPPGSIHAIEPAKLRDPAVTFRAARIGGVLAGCGALKELTACSGEIKSMKTHSAYLRQGIGAMLLAEIVAEAKRRGYTAVSLETGSHPAFRPAVAMYEKHGFVECGPFGDYHPDPYSRFFTRTLRDDA
jgi:putative acetyltransferase